MEKIQDIRSFAGGKMNLDADERYLKETEYREAWNSIVSVSENSGIGCLVNIKGNTSVFDLAINSDFTLPPGSFKCNMVVHDAQNSCIIYNLVDTVGTNHGIFRMFTANRKLEWVAKAQSIFNFHADYPVSGDVTDNLLYFTDKYESLSTPFSDQNPPRALSIIRACGYTNPYSNTKTYYNGMIVGYLGKCYKYINITQASGHLPTDVNYWLLVDAGIYLSITKNVLDRIKHPPYRPVGQSKFISVSYDSDYDYRANFIRGKLYQFTYRNVYFDKTKSVWSDFSDVPLPIQAESTTGAYLDDVCIENTINVWVWTGEHEVEKIDVAFRIGNESENWRLFYTIDKFDIDGTQLYADNIFALIQFRGDVEGMAVDKGEMSVPYHDVPQVSKINTFIDKNRLVDANFKRGFDQVKIDMTLSYGFDQLPMEPYTATFSFPKYWTEEIDVGGGRHSWFCWYKYDFSAVYRDKTQLGINMHDCGDVLRHLAVYATDGETYADFIARVANILIQMPNNPEADPKELTNYRYHNFYGEVSGNELKIRIKQNLHSTHNPPSNIPLDVTLPAGLTDITSTKTQCVKTGAWHYFGIQYYDDAGRQFPFQISDESKIYVPYATQAPSYNFLNGTVNNYAFLYWTLDSLPPQGAYYYQLFYGGTSIDTYTDFVMLASQPEVSPQSGTRYNISLVYPQTTTEYTATTGTQPYIAVRFNDAIASFNKAYPNSSVKEWTWQKGDRIRFIAYSYGGTDQRYMSMELDKEITGVTYLSGDDAYKHDSSDNTDFIVDADGNKMYDTGKSVFMVEQFDISLIPMTAYVLMEVYRPAKTSAKDKLYYAISDKMHIINPNTVTASHGAGFGTLSWGSFPQEQLVVVNPLTNVPTSMRAATGYIFGGDSYFKQRFDYNDPGLGLMFCESLQWSDYYESNAYNQGRVAVLNPNGRRSDYPTSYSWGGTYNPNSNINNITNVNGSDTVDLKQAFGEIDFVKQIGYTLKVFQKNKLTSIYIGRSGIKQANIEGEDVMGVTADIFGATIVHDEDYGTIFPLGVSYSNKALYFYDIYFGRILRNSTNGTECISDYGVRDTIYQLSKKLLLSGVNNVSVFSAYDGVNDIVFFSFIDSVTPANNCTIGFHEPTNSWIGFYSFIPDLLSSFEQSCTSFKDGKLWLHNDGTRMNFYGVQYSQSVKVVSNKEPLKIKNFKSIAVSSNKKWNCGIVGDLNIVQNDAYPRGQQSLIMDGSFVSQEGKFRASMGRNMLTTSSVPSNDDYINGNEMRGEAMEVTLRNASTDETKLFTVEVDSIYSFRG